MRSAQAIPFDQTKAEPYKLYIGRCQIGHNGFCNALLPGQFLEPSDHRLLAIFLAKFRNS